MTEDSATRAQRHSRNLRLAELSLTGQARLAAARVVVVGAGGLGAPVIAYLGAAGVGHLTLVDDDRVELSNLNRQVLFATADVGQPKAAAAAAWVRALDPALAVEALAARVTTENVRPLVAAHDLVVDASDGLPTKYLLNDACVAERRPLVHGAVTAFAGQVLVVPTGGAPCLRCLFPTLPPAGTVPSCQTVGVLGAACGVVGSLMATEAVKVLAGIPTPLVGRFLSVDVLKPRVAPLAFAARADCPACGARPTCDGTDPADYEAPACSP